MADSPHAPAPARGRLPALDGLRCFAVLWVVLFHLQAWDRIKLPGWIEPFGRMGGSGVDIFFVISGFIITWLLLREEDRYGSISLRAFYWRRGFRVFPPVITYLSVLVLVICFVPLGLTLGESLASLFFSRNLFKFPGDLTGHFWSLAVEEHFYLLWPLLLRSCPRRFRAGMILGLCAAAPVWRQLNMEVYGAPQLNWWRADLRYDHLMWGALAAVYGYEQRVRMLAPELSRRLSLFGALAAVVVVLTFARSVWVGPVRVLGSPLQAASIAFLMLLLTQGRFGVAQKVLNAGPFVWIGQISYSLYIWHPLFCKDNGHWFQSWPWALVLPVVASAASYYCIERPSYAWRDKLGAKAGLRVG